MSSKRTKSNKIKKSKKNKSKNSNFDSFFNEIKNFILEFDAIFLVDEIEINEKNMKKFSNKFFILKENENKINYQNFIVFILKLSGLEFSDKIIENNFDENYENFDYNNENLEKIIVNCKLRAKLLKVNIITNALNLVIEEIYNLYDIIKENEFNQLKKFIISILKINQNNYRKIRIISSIILSKIFELLFIDSGNIKTLISQKDQYLKSDQKIQSQISKTATKNSLILLKNKISIINELIGILKEKFILKKIADVCRDIRLIIAETLYNVSKKNFVILFEDQKITNYFPYFLNDSYNQVRLKYLQLIYYEINELNLDENENKNEEDDEKKLKIIINILKLTREAILSICIKDEKSLSKEGIKILEILSQQKILELKTVQQLIPHLFNPQIEIRLIIAKIVHSYIFNTSSSDSKIYSLSNSNIDTINSQKFTSLDYDSLFKFIEFVYKLSDNDDKMVAILIDDFQDSVKYLSHFKYFFFMIDDFVKNNSDFNFVLTCFVVVKNLVLNSRKLGGKGENIYYQDFVNFFLPLASAYLKRFRIFVGEGEKQIRVLICVVELVNVVCEAENLNLTFDFEIVKELINELKNTFFVVCGNFDFEDLKSKSVSNTKIETKSFVTDLEREKNFFEELNEITLKAINGLISNKSFVAFFNFNENSLLEDVVYGANEESIFQKFVKIINKEILTTIIYNDLTNISFENLAKKIDVVQEIQTRKLYVIFTEFNNLLIFFPKLFDNSKINFSQFVSYLLKLLSLNLISIPEDRELYFSFEYSKSIVSLIETIHLFLFNLVEIGRFESDEYLRLRNDVFNTVFSLISIEYSSSNRLYNNFLLVLKTKSIGFFLDSLVVICSHKIENASFGFRLTKPVEDFVLSFVRENFVVYFYNFNKFFLKEVNESEFEEKEILKKISVSFRENNKLFKDEATLKTFCFKFLGEKFSRLILLNFSMFKYVDFCCIFFEAFFLLKNQKIVENVAKLTLEILMDKQIEFFELQRQNSGEVSEMHVLLFYLNKISIKVFNNKSPLFESEKISLSFEDKIEMISNFVGFYKRALKSRKNKLSAEFIEYEKNFYENFILNGISFALESKRVEADENTGKKTVHLENVYFLEIVKIYLKANLYLKENDVKNVIVAFLKLSKTIELTEGVNLRHLKVIENFKSFLLNKAKVVVNENEEEKLGENIKKLNINENENVSAKIKKKKNKKKTYNEIIKEENESEIDEEENNKKKKKKVL